MKFLLKLAFIIIVFTSCKDSAMVSSQQVTNQAELHKAIKNAQPGDEIIMANGQWQDTQIRFYGNGTEKNPITLKAETAGEVVLQGESDLKIGGQYLVVDGIYFANGNSGSQSVIEYAINRDTIANHCRVTNCAIKEFNKPQRNMTDIWVQFRGRHNQLDHCYISGKSNRGPTVRVSLEGNESIKNYHKIIHNHFGPRPPKGGPSAETIQIGNSYTSMAPSYTMVANNLFEECNGEVEIISSKTNFNEFRNNVFYKSEGSLVTRHGNYCIVDGNYFIGDDESEQIGGVRLIGTGHWVTNNYFYNLKGKIFRSPLAVMNGIPKSPLNRYIQVTDVVIAYNTWINCTSPLQFGVGANLDEKDVLPASEIRSARPVRTLVANNLIYNNTADTKPIVAHDLIDGIDFKNNIINNQGGKFDAVNGVESKAFEISEIEENILVPTVEFPKFELYSGFEFDQISKDLFGNSRTDNNSIGAVSSSTSNPPDIMNLDKYGPSWDVMKSSDSKAQTHYVNSTSDLAEVIAEAKDGDMIQLEAGQHQVTSSLKIDKSLVIQSMDVNQKATIYYTGKEETPAFEMNPRGQLTLRNINLKGNKKEYAFASLKSDMSSLYNLTLSNCEVSDFDYILKAYKYSFSENLMFSSTTFKNCNNGIELSKESDDKGEYNAENIVITECTFSGIDKNVIDYYRGGYDESTVGGNLVITKSTFTKCGGQEKNGILLNTYGIINVDISNNTFLNNKVKLVALLWGAKNNSHSNNSITNSGKILVEENLKLNLLY